MDSLPWREGVIYCTIGIKGKLGIKNWELEGLVIWIASHGSFSILFFLLFFFEKKGEGFDIT
jgi:hypothetical protein